MSTSDSMKEICIQQGYVPSECKLDGMMVFLLVKEGTNPCCGCYADCHHVKQVENNKSFER